MTSAAADATRPRFPRIAASMTVVAMGLAYAITSATRRSCRPTCRGADRIDITKHLEFVASLATLTLAAAVLGAGALGDLYGMRRMYLIGFPARSLSARWPPPRRTRRC